MIYLIDPTTESYGHHVVYLNSLLKIKGTKALQMHVDIRRMKPNWLSLLKYYNAIRKQLKAVPYGCIAHLLYADIYYKIPFISSALLKRNKTIVTIHSCPNGTIKHWLMRNFCKRLTAVIVHSEYIKNQLWAMGLTNVHYIDYPSFYDYSNILSHEALKRREGISEKDVVLSALGGIRFDKGLDILLEAFKYIDAEYKKRIVLNIAGQEEFLTANKIKDICHANGIRARFIIRPLTDKEFMENVELSDYMVMPYRSRMTGNSGPMTEAIVRGVPSIVPDGSNLGYIAKRYHVGGVFKQESPIDLAHVICHFMDIKYVCNSAYAKQLEEHMFVDKHERLYSLIQTW